LLLAKRIPIKANALNPFRNPRRCEEVLSARG
jgi:hypothetical protein